MGYCRQFSRFDPLMGKVPEAPISYLPVIALRARALLSSRTAEQICSVVKDIDFVIEDYWDILKKEGVIEDAERELLVIKPTESDDDIEVIVTDLTWIPHPYKEGRYIKKPIWPEVYSTSEVEAFKKCIDWWDDIGSEDFPDGQSYEFFAVLALRLIADTIDELGFKESESIKRLPADLRVEGKRIAATSSMRIDDRYRNLKRASEYAFKAMDAVCHAEHLFQVMQLQETHKLSLLAKEAEHVEAEQKRRSIRSQNMIKGRHQENHMAKEMVIKEWEKNPSAFPSAEKAGDYFAGWLAERGLEYTQRTTRDWIREHAKRVGIKLRP